MTFTASGVNAAIVALFYRGMYMKAVTSLPSKELYNFGVLLQKNHRGVMQHRDGYKKKIQNFCVVKVISQKPLRLEGHLSGPSGNSATFTVFVDAQGQTFYQSKPEAPKGFDVEKAYIDVVKSLKVMVSRVHLEKRTGKMSTANWEGFYLRNNAGRKVGKTGEKNFDDAIQTGVVSAQFKLTCINYGFTMLKCG